MPYVVDFDKNALEIECVIKINFKIKTKWKIFLFHLTYYRLKCSASIKNKELLAVCQST